jgi:cell division protein FtsW (lipid II flippase)
MTGPPDPHRQHGQQGPHQGDDVPTQPASPHDMPTQPAGAGAPADGDVPTQPASPADMPTQPAGAPPSSADAPTQPAGAQPPGPPPGSADAPTQPAGPDGRPIADPTLDQPVLPPDLPPGADLPTAPVSGGGMASGSASVPAPAQSPEQAPVSPAMGSSPVAQRPKPISGSAPAVAPSVQAGRPATGRTGRGTELVLLIYCLLVITAMNIAIDAAALETVTLDSLTFPIVLAILAFGAHALVRVFAKHADPIILPCVVLLNGLGVTTIRRLALEPEDKEALAGPGLFGGTDGRQLLWTAVSVLLFGGTLWLIRDHRALSRLSYTVGLGGLAFVMLPAVLPASISDVNGAKIIIRVGNLISIQPGEFGKIALMVFFAAYFVQKRELLSLASKRILGIDFPRGRDLGPVIVAWVFSLLVLVFESDLGTSLMYFGVFIVMLYVATERTSWLLIGLGLFSVGAFGAYAIGLGSVATRVETWLDPFADPLDTGLQLTQSLFGLGTGGLFGAGPGAGSPGKIPLAHSDFIFTAIGEEIGLFGLTAVLMVYALLAQRGIRASLDVRDSFGKLLAGGLAFSIAWQVFVIVGGVTDLIPLTGLTTPFLAAGGSSLMANWILVALLLRISDAGRRPSPAAAPTPLRNAPTEVVRL